MNIITDMYAEVQSVVCIDKETAIFIDTTGQAIRDVNKLSNNIIETMASIPSLLEGRQTFIINLEGELIYHSTMLA